MTSRGLLWIATMVIMVCISWAIGIANWPNCRQDQVMVQRPYGGFVCVRRE